MALLTKVKKTDTPTISLMQDGDYRAPAARLEELKVHLDDLARRRTALIEGLNAQAVREQLTHRAEQFLADGVVPKITEQETVRQRGDLDAVEDELGVLRRAVELQRRAVAMAREVATRRICEQLRPRHRELVRQLAAALTAAAQANEELDDLCKELAGQDIPFTGILRPMQALFVGRADDPNSNAIMWLKDAREYGLLEG